jgi:sulfatase modifying factor 1
MRSKTWMVKLLCTAWLVAVIPLAKGQPLPGDFGTAPNAGAEAKRKSDSDRRTAEAERKAQSERAARKDAELRAAEAERRVAEAERKVAEAERKLRASTQEEPGKVFRDCADCPEMVVIPPGKFMMGSPAAEQEDAVRRGLKKEWTDWESPMHPVRIGERLAVGKYEVTRAEFGRFVAASGYKTEAEKDDGCHVLKADASDWEKKGGANWRSPGFEQTDDQPVVCVSWNDAKAYIIWLRDKTKKAYRLLSEAEWEYAARSGSQTRYPWGEDVDYREICRYANHADQSYAGSYPQKKNVNKNCSDGVVNTAEGKRYLANSFGLHNMQGNVWEWVEDCFHNDYKGAPADGSAWEIGCSNDGRVLRGGSWSIYPGILRAADRDRNSPGGRYGSVGFRLARTL